MTSSSWSQFDPDFWEVRVVDLTSWEFSLVLWILELHVELLRHVSDEHLEVAFCESLSEADSLAAVEGNPGVRVALLAVGSERELVAVVKSVRQEFCGTLPLIRIGMQTLEV